VSRLGWCYGDLGVGLSILKAGKASNNIAWQEKGNEICSKTLKRNISNAGLDEHGICHGFLGAMHMYKKVYHITEHPKYLKAIDYWYNLAFEKRDFGIDELGFFQADLLPNGKLHKYTTSGLLLGLSGVYLSLCSQNKSDIDFSWDSAFLLDTYKILG
jgi:lantibiotic modifying enzyme